MVTIYCAYLPPRRHVPRHCNAAGMLAGGTSYADFRLHAIPPIFQRRCRLPRRGQEPCRDAAGLFLTLRANAAHMKRRSKVVILVTTSPSTIEGDRAATRRYDDGFRWRRRRRCFIMPADIAGRRQRDGAASSDDVGLSRLLPRLPIIHERIDTRYAVKATSFSAQDARGHFDARDRRYMMPTYGVRVPRRASPGRSAPRACRPASVAQRHAIAATPFGHAHRCASTSPASAHWKSCH